MNALITRRHATALLTGAIAAPFIARDALAQRQLDIRGGGFQPINIAVTNFAGDAQQGPALSNIVINNFKRSVYLAPLDPGSYPEKQPNPDTQPNWDAWKTINAQYVVTGRTGRGPDGRLRTEFRLWDVASRQQAAGQQYVTDPQNSRRVAHLVSDAVFSKITGEGGFFDTRVVFVDETGSRQQRRKRLGIMDQDGANVKFITSGNELVLTPRFSPSSQDVTYMSFNDSDARVYLMNVQSGQREVVGNFPGMTFAPRFAPDGQRIVMSLSTGSNTNLYAMDLRSRSTTRLTDTAGIDTSPSYSPDGSQIVFESDRGGSQQLYIMSASGGGAKRISFGQGGRYSTPVWSPKGDYIAFTRQRGGSFGIGVMKPDGSGERTIADGFHNEGPTWAPNGLYVMFFRDPGGGGGAKIYMANITGRGEFVVPTPSFASDPSWSPLLR